MYWHTQPVHLISPTLNSPDTLINIFPATSGNYPCCLSRTFGNYCQAVQVPPTPALQFSNCRHPVRTPASKLSSARLHSCVVITGSRSFWICFWIPSDLITMASNKDVPSTVTTSPSIPSTSDAADVSARRACPRCRRRMSSLKFDKHSLCVACRDVKCSVEVRCTVSILV